MSRKLLWTLSCLEMLMRVENEKPILEPVPKRVICERLGIGTDYVEQLLSPICSKGVVRSTRGLRGGFNVSDRKMTLLEVVRLVEGDHTETDGTEKVNELVATLKDSRDGILAGMTLEDIIPEVEEEVPWIPSI